MVIQNDSLPSKSMGTVSCLHFAATMAVSLAVSTQYPNVTDIQPAKHRTTTWAALCRRASLLSRGKKTPFLACPVTVSSMCAQNIYATVRYCCARCLWCTAEQYPLRRLHTAPVPPQQPVLLLLLRLLRLRAPIVRICLPSPTSTRMIYQTTPSSSSSILPVTRITSETLCSWSTALATW